MRSTDNEVRAQLDNIDKGGVKEVKDTAKVSGEPFDPDDTPEMSTILEPPSFVSEKKLFGEYNKYEVLLDA